MTAFRGVLTWRSIAAQARTTASLMEKALGKRDEEGGESESTEGLRTITEQGTHWLRGAASYADRWGLTVMNNSRLGGSFFFFYSLCEERCGCAKLKYSFSYNYIGEF